MNATAPTDRETFVIMKTHEGYRVCSPLTPATQFVVSGLPDQAQCTCSEFERNAADPHFECEHIQAVFREASKTNGSGEGNGAGKTETAVTQPKAPVGRSDTGATMVLKRSVSPDGRIDSLSIELSCPLGGKVTQDEIIVRADKMLQLQAGIADRFLQSKAKPTPAHHGNGGNGKSSNGDCHGEQALPGQLLAVASMNTRRGKSLFLNILVNGQTLKLFGEEHELKEAVSAAGYPSVADHLANGFALNLPCRVVTRQNGRFLNVEKVLPAMSKAGNGG